MEDIRRLESLAPVLVGWYGEHVRRLPWRDHPTPYHVWVSEIMLQQTRIEAVIPYFERFMAALPTIAALARVDDERLMKLWEGLGYYSRARNLKKAAIAMMEQYGGELPPTYEALLTLPGIGEYTAGAVASICFHQRVPAVDGNVLRVMARLTACFDPVTDPKVKKRLGTLVGGLVPAEQPGAFNQALMELGETICLPNTQPHCARCPAVSLCEAYRQGCARELPVRAAKKPRRVEKRTVLIVIAVGKERRVLIHKREAKGLLAGLWELPGYVGEAQTPVIAGWLREHGGEIIRSRGLGPGRHLFSHIEWQMEGVAVETVPFDPPPDYRWVNVRQLAQEIALPSAFRPFAGFLPVLLVDEGFPPEPTQEGRT